LCKEKITLGKTSDSKNANSIYKLYIFPDRSKKKRRKEKKKIDKRARRIIQQLARA